MDADFSGGRGSTSSGLRPSRERDDLHLVKPRAPLADGDFEELIRIVNKRKIAIRKTNAGYIIRCSAIGHRFQRRRPDATVTISD